MRLHGGRGECGRLSALSRVVLGLLTVVSGCWVLVFEWAAAFVGVGFVSDGSRGIGGALLRCYPCASAWAGLLVGLALIICGFGAAISAGEGRWCLRFSARLALALAVIRASVVVLGLVHQGFEWSDIWGYLVSQCTRDVPPAACGLIVIISLCVDRWYRKRREARPKPE